MQLAISYFYQIRFFKPYMIPVSTAHFDPAWFHDYQGHEHSFLDKRGIVNGLRCEEFLGGDWGCMEHNCDGTGHCDSLTGYRKFLEENFDIKAFLKRAENSSKKLKEQLGFEEEPIVVLIVYETPKNPCSERGPLLEFFADKGIECKELKYPIGENYGKEKR